MGQVGCLHLIKDAGGLGPQPDQPGDRIGSRVERIELRVSLEFQRIPRTGQQVLGPKARQIEHAHGLLVRHGEGDGVGFRQGCYQLGTDISVGQRGGGDGKKGELVDGGQHADGRHHGRIEQVDQVFAVLE